LVLACAGGIYAVSGGGGKGRDSDFPEGHAYICLDCGEVTILSSEELFRIKSEAWQRTDSLEPARIACSSCGSENTMPATKCPRCGKYFLRSGRGRPVCPHCKQPLPSLFGDE
jgi:ribosomal protein L40E